MEHAGRLLDAEQRRGARRGAEPEGADGEPDGRDGEAGEDDDADGSETTRQRPNQETMANRPARTRTGATTGHTASQRRTSRARRMARSMRLRVSASMPGETPCA